MKEILRGFEMTSGLSINLKKSKLYGICGSSYCIETSASFLGCKIDKLPFKFLDFLVGENQRSTAFWKSVVKSLKAKLSSWKGILLSIGGRVTLINSVISNMPNYQLSLYKVPIKVID